ncbi:hypothetical protein ABT008_24505 [Micromonospora sp. NPDC002389]|uniref:hypothetical protein n=1 Tax=Micromonospora sp. NPDC002389 TaxID=3154272 RepID=UPI00331FE7F6
MTSTGADVTAAPGRTAGWWNGDPIRATALAMITLSVLWRTHVAFRGFLAADDYVLITQAAESDLTVAHLFALYNNHLMPGGRLIIWLVTEYVGLDYWPYVLLMALGQAILGVVFLQLLRRLLQPSWLILLPLGLLLFSPLTLEATSWWAVGVNMLPMQIAMVLAIRAQVDYVRTRRPRHLVALALSVLFGLFFFEKAILVVALVFLLTATLYADGGPLRTVWTTIRRWWPSWLLLTVLSLVFMAAYLTRSESSLRRPDSPDEVFSFLTQMLNSTVVPGLVGGPWQWLGAGDGAPVTAPPEIGTWASWVIVVALVVGTVRRRPRAGRAWLLLVAYLVMVAAMLAATRLGSAFSGVAGGVPRYVSDVVVVAAICLGVAVVGPARPPATAPSDAAPPDAEPAMPDPASPGSPPPGLSGPLPERYREPVAITLALVLVAVCLGTAWTMSRYGDEWAAKSGRSYIDTVRIELASAPPDTVFFDSPVPDNVVPRLSEPYNLQSRFFHALGARPTYVDEAEHPSVLDGLGRVKVATVVGSTIQPGPREGCGYLVAGGETIRIPLNEPRFSWHWVVRVGYLSSADGTATLRLGSGEAVFPIRKGLNQRFFRIVGGGDSVELTVTGTDMTLCTNEIAIGDPAPEPEG